MRSAGSLLFGLTVGLAYCSFAMGVHAQGGPDKNKPGQAACRVSFSVLQSDLHLPGGTLEGMNDAQRKWWDKKGAKKFPAACYDPAKATYKIVWWRETVSDNRVIKNTADPRFDVSVRGTRDIGFAYVKLVGANEDAKPLFFVDRDQKGTVHALESAVEFLSQHLHASQ